jgi:hypothetical protein
MASFGPGWIFFLEYAKPLIANLSFKTMPEKKLSDPINFEFEGERIQATFLFASKLWYFHNLDKGRYLFSRYDEEKGMKLSVERAKEMFLLAREDDIKYSKK